MVRAAILDDYQNVALKLADWSTIAKDVEVKIFNAPLGNDDAVIKALQGFAIVNMMRERTPFLRKVIEGLPDLKLLITTGARNASIDLKACAERGVMVCGTGGVGSPTTGIAVGLISELTRRIGYENSRMKAGDAWQVTMGLDLEGLTLGVLGLGKLGQRVSNVAKADILSLHVVLSDRTRGIVGARELGLMKKTDYLVNTSRGPLVDEKALIAALQSKAIAGAGLDVFDVEPLPRDHVFRKLDNVVLTPHLGYVAEQNYRKQYPDVVEDIRAWLDGKPVREIK